MRPQRLAELVAAGQGDGKLTLARREEQEIAALEQSVARLSDELAGLSALVSTERSEVSRHAQSEASVGRELARHGLPAQHRVGLPPKRPLEAQMSAIQARKAGAQQHLSADQTALAAKKAELERAQGALALAERGRTVSRAELREVDPELVAKNEATLAAIGKPAPAGEVDLEALAKLPKPERARALDRERTRVETELNALESAPAAATTEARTAANTRQGELFNRLVRIEELLQGTELGARK
ncbi:hypothetical protein L6R52_08425 [Myxococcota bacterium]|nr:hypothetical protein [Myxococcota bacterium]